MSSWILPGIGFSWCIELRFTVPLAAYLRGAAFSECHHCIDVSEHLKEPLGFPEIWLTLATAAYSSSL